MASEVKTCHSILYGIVKSFLCLFKQLFCLCTKRPAKVTINLLIQNIQMLVTIILENPRKNRVLGNIIERSPWKHVQCQQVIKITHHALLPFLSKFSQIISDWNCLNTMYWLIILHYSDEGLISFLVLNELVFGSCADNSFDLLHY